MGLPTVFGEDTQKKLSGVSMSTVVVVKKGGKVCIAADSLTSFGDLKLSSAYDAANDKILQFRDCYLGIVGSAAHQLVLESIINDNKILEEVDIDLSSRLSVFETFRALHPVLKDKYFLNAKDEDDTNHYRLVRMELPDFPVAMGVIRAIDSTVYESEMFDQVQHAKKETKIKTMDQLLNSGNVFESKG